MFQNDIFCRSVTACSGSPPGGNPHSNVCLTTPGEMLFHNVRIPVIILSQSWQLGRSQLLSQVTLVSMKVILQETNGSSYESLSSRSIRKKPAQAYLVPWIVIGCHCDVGVRRPFWPFDLSPRDGFRTSTLIFYPHKSTHKRSDQKGRTYSK